jgi:branched-chain amino acid aminotransferase
MVNLNGQVTPALPESFTLMQRATYYGDGLFESLRVFKRQLPFWALHWERFSNGLKVLDFDLPRHWTADFFENEIIKISPDNARVRLMVWRAQGGLYWPTDNTPQFLITTEPMESDVFEWQGRGLNVCLCDTIRLPIDTLSGIKTLNGLRYVMAAKEARAKGMDDAILLNVHGSICEATGSNVIWLKGDVVFVPPEFDGQIKGTMQQILCRLIQEDGWIVQEKSAQIADILGADELLLTNAIRGIRWVRKFEEKIYTCEKGLHFSRLLGRYLDEKLSSGRKYAAQD